MKLNVPKKFICAALSLACAFICLLGYAEAEGERLSRDIVRLHIIANSDSDEDQALKLRVRDRLLASVSPDLTKDDIPQMLGEYKRLAEEELAASGSTQSVKVEYGRFRFPTKSYGSLTYPAGKYDAVRIVLGDGAGKNWWCVLFPPLCYVRGTVDSSSAMEELKTMLSPEDYELITSGGDGRLPVKIKFKLVEWIQERFL